MEELKSLDRVIESDYAIAIVDRADAEPLLELCKRLTLTTGKAIYGWNPDNGLYRLGVNHIFIPRTRTPVDVLAYINSSRHYGIYLLTDMDGALAKPAVERQLLKLVEKSDGVRRLVIMNSGDNGLSATLAPHVARVGLDSRAQKTG